MHRTQSDACVFVCCFSRSGCAGLECVPTGFLPLVGDVATGSESVFVCMFDDKRS